VLELALDLEADDDREETGAFDEGGENQRSRLDAAGSFGLTGHSFNGLTTDAADAEANAQKGETGADGGTHQGETTTRRSLEFGRSLEKREDHWKNSTEKNRERTARVRS
jgi:hypothetical protein